MNKAEYGFRDGEMDPQKQQDTASILRITNAAVADIPSTPLDTIDKTDVLDGLVTLAVFSGATTDDLGKLEQHAKPSSEDFDNVKSVLEEFGTTPYAQGDTLTNRPNLEKISTYLDDQHLAVLREDVSPPEKETGIHRKVQDVKDLATNTKFIGVLSGGAGGAAIANVVFEQPSSAMAWTAVALINAGLAISQERDHKKQMKAKRATEIKAKHQKIQAIEDQRRS